MSLCQYWPLHWGEVDQLIIVNGLTAINADVGPVEGQGKSGPVKGTGGSPNVSGTGGFRKTGGSGGVGKIRGSGGGCG